MKKNRFWAVAPIVLLVALFIVPTSAFAHERRTVANGSPSPMALHPRLASPVGFSEYDLTGTGKEIVPPKTVGGNARGEAGKSAREWREMAARCRNFARWLDAEHRDVLLRLADEYDDRAGRAEERKGEV